MYRDDIIQPRSKSAILSITKIQRDKKNPTELKYERNGIRIPVEYESLFGIPSLSAHFIL